MWRQGGRGDGGVGGGGGGLKGSIEEEAEEVEAEEMAVKWRPMGATEEKEALRRWGHQQR